VCGGMQLLNVVLGGTLVQDIQREVQNARDHEQKHDRTQPAHPVDVKDGTMLAEFLGRGQVMVNSTHHQAVKKPGENVIVSGLQYVRAGTPVAAKPAPASPAALASR